MYNCFLISFLFDIIYGCTVQVNVDIINMGEEEANTDLLNKFIGRMPMPTLFIIMPSMPTLSLHCMHCKHSKLKI
jgi:hypothetical protein